MNPYASQPQQSQSQSINPALLASFQAGSSMNGVPNKFPSGGINPAQVMNGYGMNIPSQSSGMHPHMGMGPISSMSMNQMSSGPNGMNAISPGQLMQHQQSHHQHPSQRPMMNGMMNGPMMSNQMHMGGMSNAVGGINPAALSSPSSPSNPLNTMNPASHMMNMGINNMSTPLPNAMSPSMAMIPNAMQQQSNGMGNMSPTITATSLSGSMNHPNLPNMGGGNQPSSHHFGLNRDQYPSMPPQDRQMAQAKMMQQMPQQPQYFERPLSSASMHSLPSSVNLPQNMMPPPPPRPTTAQSTTSGVSRPGTSMDMRVRPGEGSPPASAQRSPSRSSMDNPGVGLNGFSASAPPPSQRQQTPGTSNSPPPPGSPMFRGSVPPSAPALNPMKRKMPDSPMVMPNGGGFNSIGPGSMGNSPHHQSSPNGFMQSGRDVARPMSATGVSNGTNPLAPNGNGLNMGILGMGMQSSPHSQGINPAMQHVRQASSSFLPPTIGHSTPQSQSLTPALNTPKSLTLGMIGQDPHPDPQTSLPQVSLPIGKPTGLANHGPTPVPPMTMTASTSSSGSIMRNVAIGVAQSPASLLPPGVNPAVTRLTTVPLAGSDLTIPELRDDEVADIQQWIKTDQAYEGVFRKMKANMVDEYKEDVTGPFSVRWWEKTSQSHNPGILGRRRGRENFDVRYPSSRKDRDHGRSRRPNKREGLKLPRQIPVDDALPEQLVPIRLEFDVEHHKMRETFVWNLNDPIVTPEHFAQSLVEDYNLSSNYHSVITRSIQEQLVDFKAHSNNYDGEGGDYYSTEDTLQTGTLDDQHASWWEVWRGKLRPGLAQSVSESRRPRRYPKHETLLRVAGDASKTVEELSAEPDSAHDEMRILIKLDIIVGSMKLDDQFEWDLDNSLASPEQFAEVYSQELGLNGEFRTAIAHSIREQVQTYQKYLFLIGHPADGTAVQDEELKTSFLPTLSSGARAIDQVQAYTPLLNYLSDGDLERHEKERDKDINRRRKRNTRGRRGVALPDREPIRTYRTPAIGFPELDAATLALAAAASAPVSRRAAAAAASVTIANMVASENGTPFTPATLPSAPQPQPTPRKEKKVNGLFKSPPVPSDILRPRAQVLAPTPSTAADVQGKQSAKAPPSRPRAREVEREVKEKEFADGQHANYIDGVWHCSNCGCPESLAVGRRKGPLGLNSQCGTCGKFWHRHRRPRPIEYTTDPAVHQARELEAQKPTPKKKAPSNGRTAHAIDEATESGGPSRDEEFVPPAKSPLASAQGDERPTSPVSATSNPPPPKLKVNGINVPTVTVGDGQQDPPSNESESTPLSPSRTQPPQWLADAVQTTQQKYVNDMFELALRRVNATTSAEWRIRCVDCPGKLYKPGPGETLSNFEVHLKNRQHRQRVDDRITGNS